MKTQVFKKVTRYGFRDRLADEIRIARELHGRARGWRRCRQPPSKAAYAAHPEHARIMASEAFRTDRPWSETLELARSAVTLQYRDVLREARAARDASDAEVQLLTGTAGAALFGALAGASLDWLLFRKDQSVESVLDQVLPLG